VQADRLEEQHRDEQVRLIAEDQPLNARPARALSPENASTLIMMSGSAPSVFGWA